MLLSIRSRLQHNRLLFSTELAIFGALVVLAVIGFARVVPVLLRIPDQLDLFIHYRAAGDLNAGRALYTLFIPEGAPFPPNYAEPGRFIRYSYVYPPVVAGLFRPLQLLPWSTSRAIWYGANLVFLFASIYLLNRKTQTFSSRQALLVGVLALAAPPVYDSLTLGQINVLLLLLISAAIFVFPTAEHGRGRAVAAGVLIGIAASLKLFPALLGLAFVFHRRWIALIAMAITGAALGLVGVIIGGGWQATARYLTEVLPNLSASLVSAPSNQNVRAVFDRLFSVNQFRFAVLSPTNLVTITTSPVVDVPAVGFALGYLFTIAIVLVSLLTMTSTKSGTPNSRSFLLNMTLLTCTSLLITPITWDHYYVLLLVPFFVLWKELSRWPVLPLVFLTVGLLLLFQRYWRYLTVTVNSPLVMMFGFLGVLMIWATAIYAIRRSRSLTAD